MNLNFDNKYLVFNAMISRFLIELNRLNNFLGIIKLIIYYKIIK